MSTRQIGHYWIRRESDWEVAYFNGSEWWLVGYDHDISPDSFAEIGQQCNRDDSERLARFTGIREFSLAGEPGQITGVVAGEFVPLFGQCFVELFEQAGGVNFVEWNLHHPRLGRFTITMQRCAGKSPADLLREAKEELAKCKS